MRIGIVNDVTLAVEAVRRVIIASHEHQVAWIAYDGAQAVELCSHDTPDLVLMDLIMPGVNGVEATRRIMKDSPCPIVVVTANITDNSSLVFEAMGAGALDAVNTPVLEHPEAEKGSHALLDKIETIRKLIGGEETPGRHGDSGRGARTVFQPHAPLVAIGASAGGPAALAKILGSLPADFPACVVAVQHVDQQFAQGLANWLDYQVPLQVQLAQEGVRPCCGTVLLAGRDSHLIFTRPGQLGYTLHPTESSYRPSIDVFFRSALRAWQGQIIGVLLTGMGRDGAAGLKALRNDGHLTIAQDQSTCAVYGMPKAAAELDAAAEILKLEQIGPRLRALIAKAKLHV